MIACYPAQVAALSLAALFAGSAIGAVAQPIGGLYVGAGAGWNFLQTEPAGMHRQRVAFGSGVAAVGSIGYGLGNGVRVELEGDWRGNGQSDRPSGHGDGHESKAGIMVNALFDFDAGLPFLYPYLGLGAGYQWASWSRVRVAASRSAPSSDVVADGTAGLLAYQAIIGAAVPIERVPGLSVTAEYRFLAVSGGRSYDAAAAAPAHEATRVHSSSDVNHAVLVGLRYAFAGDSTEIVTRPPLVTPAQTPVPIRTYLVFFDWDSAALSVRARDIIAEAARNSARVEHTRLEVTGHADRTGSGLVNQALSRRRAEAVASELERWGIPARQIDLRAVGDTQPLVATAAGVREPQNRRVEIVYR